MLARDVSDSVTVGGQRRTVLAVVLDVDTGLMVQALPGTSVETVLARVLKAALVSPAAPATKAVPERLVAPAELLQAVRAAAAGLNKLADTDLVEGDGLHDAEEMVDGLVGHMEGRAQPDEPPTVQDWQLLYDELAAYTTAAPWKRWTDSDWFPARLDLDGETTELDCLVLGNAGVQHGFNAVPDADNLLRAAKASANRNRFVDLEGALIVHLDPWRETHGVAADKARRYGWRSDARLVPNVLTVRGHQAADFSRNDARLLILALHGLLEQDARPRIAADANRMLTGQIAFDDGTVGRYEVGRP